MDVSIICGGQAVAGGGRQGLVPLSASCEPCTGRRTPNPFPDPAAHDDQPCAVLLCPGAEVMQMQRCLLLQHHIHLALSPRHPLRQRLQRP